MEEKKTDLLALLLRPELPNVMKELPTARYKLSRLSGLLGQEVVFTLRGLPYGRVQKLRERFGGATPAETVKAMLLPGEIADLSRAVERLCGYRRLTIEEIKNA